MSMYDGGSEGKRGVGKNYCKCDKAAKLKNLSKK